MKPNKKNTWYCDLFNQKLEKMWKFLCKVGSSKIEYDFRKSSSDCFKMKLLDAKLKALHTEPSKSQYSISPLVLVILKSPTPTVVETTLVILIITMLPLVITTSSLVITMLPLVTTTSPLDIPNLHQRSWQTTLAQRHSCANGRCRHSSKHN